MKVTHGPNDGVFDLPEGTTVFGVSRNLADAFNDDELKSISGLRATLDRVVAVSGKQNPTVRDFVEFSKRGTIHEFPVFYGSARRVADQMEQWFVERGCDGFVVAGTHLPGSYEDFTRLVVPELQRRGLFRRAYAGTTLRDHLGLKKAEIGDWKGAV